MRGKAVLRFVFLFIALFVTLADARANTGHWRSILESRSWIRNAAGSTYAFDAGKQMLDADQHCPTRVIAEFELADAREVLDMVIKTAPGSGNTGKYAQLSCLDERGEEIAVVGVKHLVDREVVVEVPRQCLRRERVRLKIEGPADRCLHLGTRELRVRSHFRPVPLVEVAPADRRSFGQCEASCKEVLGRIDGHAAVKLICDAQPGRMNGKDFVFSTPDFESVHRAYFEIRAAATSQRSELSVSCVNAYTGAEESLAYPRGVYDKHESFVFDLPAPCVLSGTTTIRVRAGKNDCIDLDAAKLFVKSKERARYPSRYVTMGGCSGGSKGERRECLKKIALSDGDYVSDFACDSEDAAFRGATVVDFSIPEWQSLERVRLFLETKGRGDDVKLRVTCLGKGSETKHVIFQGRTVEKGPASLWGEVPLDCVQYANLRIELLSEGEGCVDLDYLRVFTESSIADDREVVLENLAGYAQRVSFRPGDDIYLYVHSRYPRMDVDVFKVGRFLELVSSLRDVPVQEQLRFAQAARDGAGFKKTVSITGTGAWDSGLYFARLKTPQTTSFVTFTISQPVLSMRKDTVVLASTNTWNAYNEWGGASHYMYKEVNESERVMETHLSFLRPNVESRPGSGTPEDRAQKGHLAGAERWLLSWLKDRNIAFDMLSASDLERYPDALDGYSNVVLNVHPEYWTARMYDALQGHLRRGGSVLSLAGNGVYWKSSIRGSQMETQKRRYHHLHDGTPGGKWRDRGRPESAVMGTQYSSLGYGTHAPYKVLVADHHLFDGADISQGSEFGSDGYPTNTGVGASGWETDKISPHTPSNALVLAKGQNEVGGADIVYYETGHGGTMFSVGSLAYTRSLDKDKVVSRLTENVLRLPLRRKKVQRFSRLAQEVTDCDSRMSCSTYVLKSNELKTQSSVFVEFDAQREQNGWSEVFCLDAQNKKHHWLGLIGVQGPVTKQSRVGLPADCRGDDGTIRVLVESREEIPALKLSLVSFKNRVAHKVREVLSDVHCLDQGYCMRQIQHRDYRFLRWVACSPGLNTDSEMSNPTVFRFQTRTPLKSPRLTLKAFSAGRAGFFDLSCVDAGLEPIEMIATWLHIPLSVAKFDLSVPEACRDANDGSYRIQLRRTGANCLGLDAMELYADVL